MMDMPLPDSPKYGTRPYGDRTFEDLFTARQLAALTTFSDLVGEARARVRDDAGDDHAAAVVLYLAFALDCILSRVGRGCAWQLEGGGGPKVRPMFGRQALPMVWDYAEANPLGAATGDYGIGIETVTRALRGLA